MNVQVDAFNEEHRLLVQPTVTIGHLLEHLLTKKLGLLPATRPLDLFGLQVLNERHQAVVWADPRLSLAAAIKREGMAFQPMAIRFRLRAHAFPPSLEAVREDRAALELLYRQAEAKLLKAAEKLKKVKVNSSKKEDENLSPPQPLMDPALLATLVALSMVVDYGSFVVASSSSSSSSKDAEGAEDFPWVEEAKARAAALGVWPNNAEGAMSDAQAILAMWRLFGLMTAAEAQYNYLSLLASSEEYSVEAVRFAVWPLFSNVKEVQGMAKMKKKSGQKVEESVVAEVRLAVSYQGVEVITKKVKSKSNVDVELEQPIIEESSLTLDWSAVSCFENHKRTLTIKLAKKAEEEEDDDWTVFAGKPGQKKKKKEKKKIVLAASSTYEAHLIYLLITAYHGEHRHRVWRSEFNGGGGGNGGNGNGLQMEGITTEARFVLPQPENFFGQILAGMVQLEELKTQVKALQQQQKLQEVKMKGNDLHSVDDEDGNEEKEEVSQQPVDETSSSSSSISLYKDIEGMGNVVLLQKAKNAAEEVSAELLGILPNAKSSGAPISMAEEEEEVDEVNALLALASSNNNKSSGNNSESSESGDDLLSADDMLSADKAHLLNFPKLTFKVKTLGNKKAAAAEEGDNLQVKAEKIGGALEEELEEDEVEEDETAITAESAEELESGPSSSSCSALITSYTTSSTTSTTTTTTTTTTSTA